MITSLDNKKVKEWTKLHQKKYRLDRYLLLSKDLIKEAYCHNCLDTLIYVKKPFEFMNSYEVSQEVLDKIAKEDNLDYIGIGKRIIEKDEYRNKVIILDELQDPLNIGRIMESAYLFGFDSVILSEGCADIYNEKALEASKGAIYNLNIKRADIKEEIIKLKTQGFKVYATGLRDNTKELDELIKTDKDALVLGNEGSGVREEIFAIADEVVKIDMENIDSLNVAMAGAIVMYHFG